MLSLKLGSCWEEIAALKYQKGWTNFQDSCMFVSKSKSCQETRLAKILSIIAHHMSLLPTMLCSSHPCVLFAVLFADGLTLASVLGASHIYTHIYISPVLRTQGKLLWFECDLQIPDVWKPSPQMYACKVFWDEVVQREWRWREVRKDRCCDRMCPDSRAVRRCEGVWSHCSHVLLRSVKTQSGGLQESTAPLNVLFLCGESHSKV